VNAPEYSDLKPAWHMGRVLALREGRRVVPAQVQIVLSDLCNHDCPWCAYRMEGYASNQNFAEIRPDGTSNHNPKRFIPTPKALELVENCQTLGVLGVQFTGGGEPTVHPDHMQVFARAVDLGLSSSLVTNGNLLRDGWADVLARFAWIRVSLDAGTADTYAKTRRTPKTQFAVALSNLERLAKLGGPTIGVSYIVLRENRTECVEAARLAKQAGAGSIRFAALFSTERGAYYEGWIEEALGYVESAKALQSESFRVIDMMGDRLFDLSDRPDYRLCGYQHFNVYVGGDQNVYRCCDTSYNDHGYLGSVKDQTFREWWASAPARAAYDSFDARSCSLCAFNGKNRVLAFLADPQPKHVEFA
jgi:sulfatase maturation enzyme AslB (radical SAM superfamily)